MVIVVSFLDTGGVTRFASWVNSRIGDEMGSLSEVATSGDYDDLSGKPANATSSTAGLMSSADKSKLDGIDMSLYSTTSQVQSMIDGAIGALANGQY